MGNDSAVKTAPPVMRAGQSVFIWSRAVQVFNVYIHIYSNSGGSDSYQKRGGGKCCRPTLKQPSIAAGVSLLVIRASGATSN